MIRTINPEVVENLRALTPPHKGIEIFNIQDPERAIKTPTEKPIETTKSKNYFVWVLVAVVVTAVVYFAFIKNK